jgi:hypothetical protein
LFHEFQKRAKNSFFVALSGAIVSAAAAVDDDDDAVAADSADSV